MIPTDALDLAIYLCKRLESPVLRRRDISGVVPSDVSFSDIVAALDGTDLLVSEHSNSRTVEFSLPPNFFRTLDDLISSPKGSFCAPVRFYISEQDFLYERGGREPPDLVANYLAATTLFGLLSQVADHVVDSAGRRVLVFIHSDKFEITPDYTEADLRAKIDLEGIEFFRSEFLDSDLHVGQKRSIIKSVFLDAFSGRRHIPFSEVLSSFSDILDRALSSYQLYVSEFSFQKVKEQVELEKLEATIKLNGVFSKIQNQLLAVPAALVLVGGQMVEGSGWDARNMLLWLGALVFAVFMDLLVRNQRHTLFAVRDEISHQWDQMQGRYDAVAYKFADTYRQLERRYVHQNRLISVVDLLVALTLAVTSGMLVYYAIPSSGEFLVKISLAVAIVATAIFIKKIFWPPRAPT